METLFPQRVKCKNCRKALGAAYDDEVLFGLYCSTKCASLPPAPKVASKAPRSCVTWRKGHWQWKKSYRCESEIPQKLREDPSTRWYWCEWGHLHIGHTRMGESESLRMFASMDDIGDMLTKLRGQASIKDVAAAAKVRPIRLRELEEGIRHPPSVNQDRLDTLMKVLPVLQSRLGATIRDQNVTKDKKVSTVRGRR